MITRSLIVVPLLISVSMLTPVATAAPVAVTTTPKALSLTVNDVQHQYGAAFRSFIVHAYTASKYKTCGANYTGGYLATFANFGKAGKPVGVVSVQSSVFAYADARSTACVSSTHGASLAKMLSRHGTTVRWSRLNNVGDSASLFTSTSPAGAGKHAYSVMIWLSRGRHVASITVSALGSAPAQAGAITLAKIVDGRIQAAG